MALPLVDVSAIGAKFETRTGISEAEVSRVSGQMLMQLNLTDLPTEYPTTDEHGLTH
jgi:hypothetical protein